MKISFITVPVLLVGALVTAMLTQGVNGGPALTNRDEDVVRDSVGETEGVYRQKSLYGVNGGPALTNRDKDVVRDSVAETERVYRQKSLYGVNGGPAHANTDEDSVAESERVYRENSPYDDRGLKQRAVGIASIIATASAAIGAGTSLAGTGMTALMNTGHTVVVGIEIDNYSNWVLSDAHTYIGGGYVSTPARDVQPGKREAMVAHKSSNTATGTYGTVSWLVSNGKGQRIIVMWSVPYNHDYYTNWLAVGIIRDGEEGEHWFDKMYYKSGPFVRGQYYYSSQSIDYCDGDMCLRGSMGTSHKPKVVISFYPKREDDLAPGVKAAI